MDAESRLYPVLIAFRASDELDRRLAELTTLANTTHPDLKITRSDLLRHHVGQMTPASLPLIWQPAHTHAPFQAFPTGLATVLAMLLNVSVAEVQQDPDIWAHLGELMRLVEVFVRQHRHTP